MKTMLHGRRAHHGHDEFSAPVFFGIAVLIAVLFAGAAFWVGMLFGFSEFLAHKRVPLVLFSILVGLCASSALTDRRRPRD